MANLLQKLGVGLVGAGMISALNSTPAHSQELYPKDSDHGAKFFLDKGHSNYSLEEKVIFGKRFYFHYRENARPDELDIAALDIHDVEIILNADTKKPEELKANKEYIFKKIKSSNGEYFSKLKLPTSGENKVRIAGWCDVQMKKGFSPDNPGYTTTKSINDLVPGLRVFKLGDGREFYYPHVSEAQTGKEGETDFYLIPKENAQLVLDYKDKSVSIVGDIYRGILSASKIEAANGKAGLSNLKTKSTQGQNKTSGKGTFYLILGANANLAFGEGDLGFQYGPVAFVGNLGKAGDEDVASLETSPSSTGRYGTGNKKNTNILLIGISGELHPFYNKKVSPFIGGGLEHWTSNINVDEDIRDANNNIIAQNVQSKPNKEDSWRAYGGLNFKTNKSKFGIQAGYSSKQKFFAGVRYSIKLGK